MESTLNVRIDATLKQRGDAVLREHGIGTSEAVRALWRYLARSHDIPEFMKKESAQDAKQLKKAALFDLLGVAEGRLSNATDAELEALGRARYA